MKKTLLSLMLGAAVWVHAQADDIASIQFDYADDRTATGLKTTAFCAAQNNDANWSLESATGSHSSALLEAFTDPKCTGFSGDNRVMDADAVGRYLRESVMVDAENGYPTGAFAVSKVTGEAKTVIGFSSKKVQLMALPPFLFARHWHFLMYLNQRQLQKHRQ